MKQILGAVGVCCTWVLYSNALPDITTYKNSSEATTITHYYERYQQSPDDPKTIEDLAYVLSYAEYDLDAITLYLKLLQRNPLHADALCNIAFMLVRAGYVKEAIELYERSLVYKENAVTRLNLAIAYLTAGDLERGFSAYEYRWQSRGCEHNDFLGQWHGENLQGKTICIHSEQGFGDTFMFMRYLKMLKEMGACVFFVVHPALKTIISLCPYIDMVTTYDDPLPESDYFCALLSVPYVLKTRLETIPATIPYLCADAQLVDLWKQRLADDSHFKVGICWHGKADYQKSCTSTFLAARSCQLNSFKPLAAIPGVRLYSLQKIYGVDQIELCDAAGWLEIFDESFDRDHGRFMDTAALIQNLDLVITIDTSVAHLAAGLGTPTWILIPEPADWRWMRNRTDTSWYPEVRLFRQQTPGNWAAVIETISYALAKEVTYRSLLQQLNVS
jgi:tetratricopeptide (TPR) repeat protein